MNGEQKLTPEHLARRAIVYLRQSSEGQVRNNIESQKLQYGLADRAKTLGFREVEVTAVPQRCVNKARNPTNSLDCELRKTQSRTGGSEPWHIVVPSLRSF